MELRRCYVCGQSKQLTAKFFYTNKVPKYHGFRLECKECTHKYNISQKRKDIVRKYNISQKGRITAAKYIQSVRGRKQRARQAAIERRRYPEKQKARLIIKQEKKMGRLISKPCIICAEIKTEAHHENYYKPMNIIWLCHLHHREVDGQMRGQR